MVLINTKVDISGFRIICKQCKAESVTVTYNGPGCDSCGYGSYSEISCNNCSNDAKYD